MKAMRYQMRAADMPITMKIANGGPKIGIKQRMIRRMSRTVPWLCIELLARSRRDARLVTHHSHLDGFLEAARQRRKRDVRRCSTFRDKSEEVTPINSASVAEQTKASNQSAARH